MAYFFKKRNNALAQDPVYNRELIKNASTICSYFRFMDRSQIYDLAIEKLKTIINKNDCKVQNEDTLVVEENEIKGIF